MKDKLTDKQRAFVAEYPIDKNLTKAAERAGYSAKTAYSQGQRLLKNVEIKTLVNQKLAELEEKAGLTAERVMLEVKAIATSNIMDALEYDPDTREFTFRDPDQIPEEFWMAAQEVTTFQLPDGGGLALKIKMHPKLPALKMEYDRHKLTNPDTGTTSIGTIHISVLNERRKRAGMELIEEE